MANDEIGVAHWIDHIVVPTNDMASWVEWAENVIGVERKPIGGLTTQARNNNRPIASFVDIGDGSCHFGAFLQNGVLSESKGLGADYPRYGFYIRPEEVDAHLLRLDSTGTPHTDAITTTAEGEEGTAIYLQDPDGNQFEFWAPKVMPAGAMEVSTRFGVGRISSAVYGSRDLQRTASFYERYCGLKRAKRQDIPEDTLVLPLASGGRLVYHLTDGVDARLTGHGPWFAMHLAFTVPADLYMNNYERLWAEVVEETGTKESLGLSEAEEDELPARTGLHGSPAGKKWKEMYKRGDEIYDWDGHAFHLIGGISKTSGGSLATYIPKEQHQYLAELAAIAAR
jgi:catechol 2,3-dioxygenase-like lactoylglutathione lyase family enzyme